MTDISKLLEPIRTIHAAVRDHVAGNLERLADEHTARAVVTEEAADTIYAIDRLSEELLVDLPGSVPICATTSSAMRRLRPAFRH